MMVPGGMKMNPIAKMLIDMAKFYSEALDERQLEMYVKVLTQFPTELVLECGKEYVHDVRNTRFPIPPHKIMERHLPKQATPKDVARDTSLRIRTAVSKYGWCNPNEARDYIGETGWQIVERFGGWMHICQNLGVEIQESTFLAQTRDAVESELNLQSAGIDTKRPSIEQAKNKGQLGDLLKTLGKALSITGRNE